MTADDLQEATARVSRAIAPPERQVESLLLFLLRKETFAIPVTSVQCVTRPASVHRIPHRSNKIIRGMCNVDGELLLCVDLASLLDIGAKQLGEESSSDAHAGDQDDDARRMIVMGEASGPWVTEIDALSGVIRTDPANYRPPPITVEHALSRFTSWLVPCGDGHAALLDVQRLLAGFEAALP